jgi:hypothetical protein
VTRDTYVTGAYNNRVRVSGDMAYIVASGDNRVELVDLTTCTSHSGSCENDGFAIFDVGSNPWDITVSGGMLYTSMLFGGAGFNGAVGVASASDWTFGELVEGNTMELDDPQGVAVIGDKLYVGNTVLDWDGMNLTWGDAFVTVYNLPGYTKEATIPLPYKNPFDMTVFGGKLIVTCTGSFGADYLPDSDGGLVFIDPATDTVEGQVTLGLTSPGPNIAVVGNLGYLASAQGPHLLKVNLDTKTVLRGELNPIELPATGFTSYAVPLPGGLVAASSFLDDGVYLVDSTTDEVVDVDPATAEVDPFRVGPGGETPAGPQAMDTWTDGQGRTHILVIGTLANSMSDIVLQ